MNEQKYYVKLKPSISVIVEHDDQDNEIEFGYGYLNGLHEFSPMTPGNTFTKSELSEVMNGGLYKEIKGLAEYEADTLADSKTGWSYTDEIITDIEWINPLIELIPVKRGLNMNEKKYYEVCVGCGDEIRYLRVKAFDEDDAINKVFDDDWFSEFKDEEIDNATIEEIYECD